MRSSHRTAVRYILPILGLLLLVGGLASVKTAQISSLIHMGAAMQKAGPPPETVGTATSQTQDWEDTISAVGSVTAARGVSVSNDAPGVVSRILFDSGAVVKAGQVLVELDTSVERAQLASAQAKKDLAGLTVGRSRALAGSNSIPQSQVDSDEAQLKTSTTDFGALAAQIDRKTIRAPFAGRLGIRTVNLGQYLNPGTSVTVLQAIDSVYADFALPQQRLADVKLQTPVRITLDGATGPSLEGAVAAIDPTVDSSTRMISVRASIPNKDETLRPGMFVTVKVVLPHRDSVVTVPATALVHAAYGDSVFVVQDAKDPSGAPIKGADGNPTKSARQQFVRVGEARGDFVSVTNGLAAGEQVVVAGAFKLHNGSPVVVNNDVKLDAQLSPKPDNR